MGIVKPGQQRQPPAVNNLHPPRPFLVILSKANIVLSKVLITLSKASVILSKALVILSVAKNLTIAAHRRDAPPGNRHGIGARARLRQSKHIGVKQNQANVH